LDLETAIYYFRARYYHAELGRFISRDPIGYVDGMNLYRAYFVLRGKDPSGFGARWTIAKQQPEGPPPVKSLDPQEPSNPEPIPAKPSSSKWRFGGCRTSITLDLPAGITPKELGIPFPGGNWGAFCPPCPFCFNLDIRASRFKLEIGEIVEREPGGCTLNGAVVDGTSINLGLGLVKGARFSYYKGCGKGDKCIGPTLKRQTTKFIPVVLPINGGKCIIKGFLFFQFEYSYKVGLCGKDANPPKQPPTFGPGGGGNEFFSERS
jgi:hypothetical protein